ncbi:microtubule-associated tumor suppressor candidate 2 homolog isoform X2 [Ptychodera flava]|uniref:microtubule-associated tumor suppressor candidate 2 homolog isoform X2 n=1 Tax=Ptychodera flava TaxID=63121 RepID=UPI003969DE92
MPTKTDSPKKKSDVTAAKSSKVVIPPLKLGTGDKKTNGTDRNIVSPQRSFSSSSSISRSRERLTSPTGRRGSLDSSRGTSPARSSSESLPKKTYTPSSWRTDKPSSPPESKDRGVLSPRRRADLQILPPKLNFAAVKSKIDTGRKLGAKRDDKDGDDSFLKPEPLSQSFPPAKSADSAERSSTFSNKLSKFEISSATSKGQPVPSAKLKAFIEGSSFWNEIRGSKPINRTTQALRSNAATTKTGERRGSSSSIASDISQKSDISRGSRRSSTSSPRGAIGGGANNPIPLRLQSTSTSKLRPPQATTDSRSKSASAGKGKPTSAAASTAITTTTTTTTTTTSTTSTSKVPIRPSSKSLSRIKSAQSASSSSQNAAASSAAATANLTTSASSKALSAVRRGSEHGTQSTAGARQRPSSGRVLPATPSTTRKPADQNRERRGSARSKVTPSSTSQPDLVSTSIASENVSKEIKRLEALCEARTKELTLMKIQFKQGLTGFDAMATLVRYMTEELDAFSGPVLSQKLQVLQKEIENARQLIAKQEKELSDLHTEKTTLSEKYEDEVDKLKTETDELKEQHKKEIEALTTKLNDEHMTNLETLEDNLKKNHDEEKESLLEKHSQELVKARSDYASNLQRIKAQHREELSELTRIQKLTLEETVDEYKEKLSKQSSEHQQLVDGMTQEYTSKMKKLTTDFETKNRTLQDEVETLTFQCQNYKDRVKTLEENLHRDVDVKLQLALAPYKDLQAEVESLKCVLELKRVEMQELRSQKNELSKQLEKIPEMEETIKKLEAKNESLNASLEKKVSYERQLSSEHLVLREHFEKETQVNKRLSRENEELVWKLQNSDSGSPLTGLTPSSTRSTLSPSPTHSHPHGHLHRDSHTLSRSSSTDSHESGVFPLSPSQ